MKRNLELYKRRLALVLAFILTVGNVIPVSADSLSVNTAVTVADTAVSTDGSTAEGAQDQGETVSAPAAEFVSDPVLPETETVSGGQAGEGSSSGNAAVSDDAAESTVSEDTVSGDTVSDGSVSGNVSENLTVSGNVSEDAAGDEEDKAADATIMYYMVGSNLEGNGAEATRDMVEIMTGMEWAENATNAVSNAKINVIVETGGVSDKAMQAGGSHARAIQDLKDLFGEGGSAASKNDLKILNIIDSAGIQWNKNERWVLSGSRIVKAENDDNNNRTRVMTGIKSEGKAPELIDFIKTTAEEYPARNYMLVLWDHGGGPAGGFGGDDRGGKESSYITNDQLTKSLSEARAGIRELESVSYNKNFDRFAFVGFDACLMGNLETAMSLEPYAKYLFASEDLEPGTGWDHRGYVEELLRPNAMKDLSEGTSCYDPDFVNHTIKDIGFQMVEDNRFYYDNNEIQSTMSVVSLNSTSFNSLNEALNDLAVAVSKNMIGNNGEFNRDGYVKLLEAAEEAICFSGPTSGIVDLYSFCTKLAEKFSDGGNGVGAAAGNVEKLLRPDGHKNDTVNDGLITVQQYTSKYYFADEKTAPDYEALGGLTIFLPYTGNRYTAGGETYDSFKDYLNIYKNVDSKSILTDGYTSLVKAFCAAQAIGLVLSEQYDKTPEQISASMNAVAEAIKKDYAPLSTAIEKMMDNMASESGNIIAGRLSSNDLQMKTVISDNKKLYYAIDFKNEKQKLVKVIRQEPVFKDNSGVEYRFGYLPAAKAPYGLYENGDSNTPAGSSRNEIDNFKEQKWFFVNDKYPAAVLNVKNYTGEEVEQFDPFSEENHIMAQFPAVMQKAETDYYSLVVIETDFSTGSMNKIAPTGYYSVDTDYKQLTGFVPWSAVDEGTGFALVSDLGEYFENTYNIFEAADIQKTRYTDLIYKADMVFSRGSEKSLSDGFNNLTNKFASYSNEYIAKDIFGGLYGISDLRDGEGVTVYITLSRNDSNGNPYNGSVDYISENTSGVYPNVSYVVNSGEYRLSFNEAYAPSVGYYDVNGAFHSLETSEDFANLIPGNYRLTLEGYDSEKDRVIIQEGVKINVISGNGELIERDAADYAFITDVDNTILTVGNKDKGLTIEPVSGVTELPYGFYKTIHELPYTDLGSFVTVKNGDGDVTDSVYRDYTISANGKTYAVNISDNLIAFENLNLKVGDVISINATFNAGGEILKTESPVELKIGRQPVKLYSVQNYMTREFDEEDIFWSEKNNNHNSTKVQIVMHLNGKDYEDRKFGYYVGKADLDIKDILSANNTVSAVYIDNSGAKGAGIYENLRLGPDDGNGKIGYWEDKHFKTEFSGYLYIDDPDDAVLKTYVVDPAVEIKFRSLKDDTVLAEDYIKMASEFEEGDAGDKRYSVSGGSIVIAGAPVKQWYVGIGLNKRIPVYLDGKAISCNEYEGDENVSLNMVVSGNKANEWYFKVPRSASSNRVIFYADYEEAVSTVKQTGKVSFNIAVDPVEPVEYTGKALVTMTSGRNGSRSIKLVVKDTSGNALTEGTDYTVSYKNNKNAAGPSAGKKAPTLIVTGKGKTYRGLKAEVTFTILPADLKYATVALNKQFAPFTAAGKISVTASLKLSSGVKIPASQYTVRYYYAGDELTKNEIKKLYNGNDTRLIEIQISANKLKSGAQNYRIGSMADSVYVTGYPKGSKSLTVKLSKSKQDFGDFNNTYKTEDLVEKVLKKDYLKVGKEKVDASDLLKVKAYTDRNLVYPADNDGETINRAGTYYLSFELNDTAKQKYKVYKPTVVRYIMTGKKLVKGKTKIDAVKNTVSFNGSGVSVPVKVSIDTTKLTAKEMRVTYVTKDGTTYSGIAGYEDNEAAYKAKYNTGYDYKIDKNGLLILDYLDNGAKGSYTLTFEGINDYTGSFKLTYNVK